MDNGKSRVARRPRHWMPGSGHYQSRGAAWHDGTAGALDSGSMANRGAHRQGGRAKALRMQNGQLFVYWGIFRR